MPRQPWHAPLLAALTLVGVHVRVIAWNRVCQPWHTGKGYQRTPTHKPGEWCRSFCSFACPSSHGRTQVHSCSAPLPATQIIGEPLPTPLRLPPHTTEKIARRHLAYGQHNRTRATLSGARLNNRTRSSAVKQAGYEYLVTRGMNAALKGEQEPKTCLRAAQLSCTCR